ncbi:MAG: transcriptional regulator [Rhodospirillales bacterium]
MEQRDLSGAAGVSLETVKRLEKIHGPVSARDETLERLRTALEAAGVVFIASNGQGPGVRLRGPGE